jgi:hypothetical protein
MRRTLYHGLMIALLGLTGASTGCRSWGWSTPSWLSWGGKSNTTTGTASLASRPSTQLPPSPSATMGPTGGYASGTQGTPAGATGYTGTPYGKNYSTQQASTAPGYATGPYNTGAPAQTTPYGAAAGAYPTGRPASTPTYAAPQNNYNAPQSPYSAPPAGYGAATGYGGGPSASQPAYPNTGAPSVASYGAGNPAQTPIQPTAAPSYPSTNVAGVANREGGYKPGSTGRSVTADGALRNNPTVQPVEYQSGAPGGESVPEYNPSQPSAAPAESAGGGSFVLPGG